MQKESLLFFSFSNRRSSECHQFYLNGWVAREENVVNESTFGEAKVRISEQNAKDFELFLFPPYGFRRSGRKRIRQRIAWAHLLHNPWRGCCYPLPYRSHQPSLNMSCCCSLPSHCSPLCPDKNYCCSWCHHCCWSFPADGYCCRVYPHYCWFAPPQSYYCSWRSRHYQSEPSPTGCCSLSSEPDKPQHTPTAPASVSSSFS